jgi:hypothetical protein
MRPLSPVRRAPAGARHARLGSDTPAKAFSRHHRIPRGRPRLLAARWPRATGLTSYLSSCVVLAVGRRRFEAPFGFQKVVHTLPGVVPSRLPSPLTFPHCEWGSFGEVVSRKRWQPCWFAVATGTFAVTAFPPAIETFAGFSLSQLDGLRHPEAVSRRRLQDSNCRMVRPGATRLGGIRELMPWHPL